MTDRGSGKYEHGASNPAGQPSFFSELRKRRVFRAAAAYAVVAWGATEILDGVISRFGWPDWIATLVVILFVVGFPVTMFLAWVFDWTRTGIRRTEPWTAAGGLSIGLAAVFLIAGSAGLFWLINPSGVARVQQTGVAVLPCRFRGDPEFAFLGAGVAMLLNEELAHSRQLFVPEFDAVTRLSAEKLPTAGLADGLHVSWLLECRVIQEEGRLRFETGLIDASSDESEELTSLDVGSLELVSALDQISRAVRERLEALPENGQTVAPSDYLPSTTRALEAYLKGEQAYRVGTVESLREAREQFRLAQIVPCPLARVREADVLMGLLEVEPPEDSRSVETQLRAVSLILGELDKNARSPAELYVAHLRFARLSDRFGYGEPASKEERRAWFDRALAGKPNDAEPYLLLADYLEGTGDREDAAELDNKAARLLAGNLD